MGHKHLHGRFKVKIRPLQGVFQFRLGHGGKDRRENVERSHATKLVLFRVGCRCVRARPLGRRQEWILWLSAGEWLKDARFVAEQGLVVMMQFRHARSKW